MIRSSIEPVSYDGAEAAGAQRGSEDATGEKL
jgi:hypothetical protein